MIRQICAVALFLTISAGAAAQDKEAEAARLVDTAMAPCFKNAIPPLPEQMRVMLLIKARAIVDDRPLTQAEQTRADGMMVSFNDPAAYEAMGCVAAGSSMLAEWAAKTMWAGVIPNDAIDPKAEAKRIAKICTWGVGESRRDRYAEMLAKYLRWQFIGKLEKRSLDPAEKRQFKRDRKALSDVIPEKTGRELIECVAEVTKGTPVEIRLTQQAKDQQLRAVQTALQQAGLYQGQIDGTWGPQTKSAVTAFQQQKNLPATGTLDQPTLTAMEISSQ